ncbi:MAG: hypothetical protein ACKO37_06295 [Vampirovibrionales bacterium]
MQAFPMTTLQAIASLKPWFRDTPSSHSHASSVSPSKVSQVSQGIQTSPIGLPSRNIKNLGVRSGHSLSMNHKLLPTWEDVAVQRLQKLGTLTYKTVGNYLQRHDMFSSNAFIGGAAILCAARIKIANQSAAEAKYTPQEQQRKREAITTTTREVLGWSLSYGLLRLIQTGVCDILRAATGLRITHHDQVTPLGLAAVFTLRPFRTMFKGITHYTQQAWELLQGRPVSLALTPAKGPAVYKLHPEKSWFLKHPESFLSKRFAALGEAKLKQEVHALGKPLPKAIPHATKVLEGVKQVYQVAPAYVGSIPALLLSGIALEWLSLRYGKQIVALLSKHVEYGDPNDFLPVSGPTRVPSLRVYNLPALEQTKAQKERTTTEFTTSLEVKPLVTSIPITAETASTMSLADVTAKHHTTTEPS